ncbi:hypothetical protein AVO45_07840 [Ruegeria marisrubri]|uniref:Uncharacterized protein n=1 Tax=Ruegeria marisrubri TaxID=1685379 RepID=A0A0X3TQ49_9RHOB|nr:hypothetical protein [Ruegeria marisrubri]KUJ77878.1 hypothetical protein AVO45_07840 [Ruegeria marisrubri]
MSASEALWQSTRNLLDVQVNLEKLYDAFDTVELDETGKGGLIIEFDSNTYEGGDWVRPVWNAYYKVNERLNVGKDKEKKKGLGYITLAIQLTSDPGHGDDWEYGRQAKVLVGYCPSPKSDDRWEFDTANPEGAGESEDGNPRGSLWVYCDDDRSWFYAVQLEALDRPEAVDGYLVNPLRALIKGNAPEKVFGPIKDKLCIPPQKA